MRGRGRRGRGRGPPNRASIPSFPATNLSKDAIPDKAGYGSKERKAHLNQVREISEQLDSIDLEVSNPSDDELDLTTNHGEVDEVLKDLESLGSRFGDVEVGKTVEVLDNQKLWVDVIKGNRVPRKEAMMEFESPVLVDGEPIIEIEMEDTESEVEFWQAGLILFAVGKDLTMNAVKQFMMKIWNTVAIPSLYYHDDGYFIARFSKGEERDFILQNGPYTIYNMPLFVRKWTPKFVMKDDLLRVMPIWVTFPSLPLHLWGKKNLSKIASAIGIPVMADECTIKKLRVSYARVLVEMDITKERKNFISIRDADGRLFEQNVKYEWTPLFCHECQKVGHKCNNAKGKGETKEWKEKRRLQKVL